MKLEKLKQEWTKEDNSLVSAFKTYHSSLKGNGTVGVIGVLIAYFYPEYLDDESELPASEGGNLQKK